MPTHDGIADSEVTNSLESGNDWMSNNRRCIVIQKLFR